MIRKFKQMSVYLMPELAILLIVFFIAEGIYTKEIVLQSYGFEINPIVNYLGVWNLLIYKMIGAALVAVFIVSLWGKRPYLISPVVLIFSIFYFVLYVCNMGYYYLGLISQKIN